MKKQLLMILAVAVLLTGCNNADKKDTEANIQQTEAESSVIDQDEETSSATSETTETTPEIETEAQTEVETEAVVHEHTYTGQVTIAATCTQKGEKIFSCECGNTYTEEIAVIAHSYEAFIYNNDATQQADGTQSRSCSVCGKVDTQTAKGTKLPFDPYSLRAVASLNEIPVVGTLTSTDASLYNQVRNNIDAGNYEKVRYITSTGDQFCMWNVRLADERDKEAFGITTYYWFMAPIENEFSSGYKHSNFVSVDASDADKKMIAIGRNVSGSVNESMLNRVNLPPAFETINSAECPVSLYEIVETDAMIYVWLEGTNCGQAGVGTCGSFDCKQTCLRYKTFEQLQKMPIEKGWTSWTGGESNRMNWNGKLLVKFYQLKY